jgi:hypothetical protein
MFIGHLGAGLALKKMDRNTNLGWFVASVLALDFLLWIFVLLNIESVIIPENYSEIHYLLFQYSFSHSLMASLCWGALVFIVVWLISRRSLTAGAMAIGVFSHFVFDFIAHPPRLPLMGEDSMKVGLSLWNNMPVELSLEFVLLGTGMYLYLSTTTSAKAGGKYGLVVLMLFLTIAAFTGQMIGPAPQSGVQVAFSSLFTIAVTVLLTFYLDKKRISKPI